MLSALCNVRKFSANFYETMAEREQKKMNRIIIIIHKHDDIIKCV